MGGRGGRQLSRKLNSFCYKIPVQVVNEEERKTKEDENDSSSDKTNLH